MSSYVLPPAGPVFNKAWSDGPQVCNFYKYYFEQCVKDGSTASGKVVVDGDGSRSEMFILGWLLKTGVHTARHHLNDTDAYDVSVGLEPSDRFYIEVKSYLAFEFTEISPAEKAKCHFVCFVERSQHGQYLVSVERMIK